MSKINSTIFQTLKMSKVLRLYNTFTKTLNNVELSGKLISCPSNIADHQPIRGSFYICGPTVYSDSHVGHALTYIRADLFRRFMKSLFNVRLTTVMNITDIDDKILLRAKEKFGNTKENFSTEPTSHPFNRISDKYYKLFIKDLECIKVLPADLYVKVSKHIHLITNFIQKLEQDGHAYIAQTGDVYFNVQSVKSYKGRVDGRKEIPSEDFKIDQRDFVLWKYAKPNEPTWSYQSTKTGKIIPGRPGWHVQCSAISSALFGEKLDFHFGGKDLIFPHHYNEEACCCAYHKLNTSESMHVWANHWLHSGHLILRETKMSKSIGNTIAINNFIGRSSVNALRLLCIHYHYRTDIEFNEELLERLKAIDHKISAFNSFLAEKLQHAQENLNLMDQDEWLGNEDVKRAVHTTAQDIIDGACDDLHLNRGLDSILDLSKLIYAKGREELRPQDLIAAWNLLKDWCATCGLSYAHMSGDKTSHGESSLELLLDFRQQVRAWALNELNSKQDPNYKLSIQKLLKECDNIRTRLDELGFVARDPHSKKL